MKNTSSTTETQAPDSAAGVTTAPRVSLSQSRSLINLIPGSFWEVDLKPVQPTFARWRRAEIEDLGAHLDAHPEELIALLQRVEVVRVNEETLRLFGAPDLETLNRRLVDIYLPESLAPLRDSVVVFYRGDRSFEGENVHRRLDGDRFYVRSVLQLEGPGDPAETLFINLMDISERVALENDLRRTKSLYEHALHGTELGVWDWNFATRKIFLSDSYRSLLGYGAELPEGDEELMAYIHEEDREDVHRRVLAFFHGDTDDLELHMRMLKKSGDWAWFRSRGKVLERDPEGRAARAVGTLRNTHQEELSRRLFELERTILALAAGGAPIDETLATLAQGIDQIWGYTHSAVHVLEGDGKTVAFGLAPSLPEAYGSAVAGLVLTPETGACGAAIACGARRVIPDIAEDPLYNVLGPGLLDMGIRGAWSIPLVAGSEDVVGTFCIYLKSRREILQEDSLLLDRASQLASLLLEKHYQKVARKELEDRRLHSQKLESLGLMAGGIAHDFNNILMAILANAELVGASVGEGGEQASEARESAEQIQKAAHRAAELCRQMLTYAGHGDPVREDVDLESIIDDIASLVGSTISKNVQVRIEKKTPLPTLSGDAGLLSQIVLNLLTNAAEAIGNETGEIRVETGTLAVDETKLTHLFGHENLIPGPYAYLSVTDTGCGMDAATRARIFDPFFTTKFQGRGLGLAAALGIVRQHKGGITVRSEPGAGTAFTVLLPAKGEVPVQASAAVEKAGESADITALVVDDEPLVRKALVGLLKAHGLQILTADSGAEALELFRERASEIDVIILDQTMPGMDGFETHRRLMEVQVTPTLFISGRIPDEDMSALLVGEGRVGFIQKPFRYAAMLEEMRRVLEARPGNG